LLKINKRYNLMPKESLRKDKVFSVLSLLITVWLVGAAGFSQPEEKLNARDLFLSGSKTDYPIASKSPSPLGLRYSILKQISGGESMEVDPDSLFQSGDKIRLNVEVNNKGYLYIVARGTSGRWKLLFPGKEILAGDYVVDKGNKYEVPLGSFWIIFDSQPGVEKLFMILSRQPEPNLEKLIRSIRQGNALGVAQTQDTPSVQESSEKSQDGSVQVASSLDDATVNKVRGQVTSRDLVLEKVNEENSGAKKENAVYVVNPSGSGDSRVVVDVSLNHQ
jgi:hypothetical protein